MKTKVTVEVDGAEPAVYVMEDVRIESSRPVRPIYFSGREKILEVAGSTNITITGTLCKDSSDIDPAGEVKSGMSEEEMSRFSSIIRRKKYQNAIKAMQEKRKQSSWPNEHYIEPFEKADPTPHPAAIVRDTTKKGEGKIVGVVEDFRYLKGGGLLFTDVMVRIGPKGPQRDTIIANRQQLKEICKERYVEKLLYPEPDNKYDANALRLCFSPHHRQLFLGYVAKEVSAVVASVPEQCIEVLSIKQLPGCGMRVNFIASPTVSISWLKDLRIHLDSELFVTSVDDEVRRM